VLVKAGIVVRLMAKADDFLFSGTPTQALRPANLLFARKRGVFHELERARI
jgi:hypothetical protein